MPNLANQDFTQFKREQQTAPAWFRILRGGRMTKWKGKVASYAPHVAPAIGWAFSRTLQLSLISLVMAGTAAASDRSLLGFQWHRCGARRVWRLEYE